MRRARLRVGWPSAFAGESASATSSLTRQTALSGRRAWPERPCSGAAPAAGVPGSPCIILVCLASRAAAVRTDPPSQTVRRRSSAPGRVAASNPPGEQQTHSVGQTARGSRQPPAPARGCSAQRPASGGTRGARGERQGELRRRPHANSFAPVRGSTSSSVPGRGLATTMPPRSSMRFSSSAAIASRSSLSPSFSSSVGSSAVEDSAAFCAAQMRAICRDTTTTSDGRTGK